MTPAATHLVIIPSYNTGPKLVETVGQALAFWRPVWVVVDGSTDGSADLLAQRYGREPGLRIIKLDCNSGKGAAVLNGFREARDAGFTHALVMDADGQHPPDHIVRFMEVSRENPGAMVLGVPQFAADSPASRRHGRRVGNWWANLETFWGGIDDSLFGFRVYPLEPSLVILEKTSRGRRYDFDTELVVRLFWSGVAPIDLPVPVRYFTPAEGGVSHFRYGRDNWLLFRRHTRLVLEMLPQMRRVWKLRQRARALRQPVNPG